MKTNSRLILRGHEAFKLRIQIDVPITPPDENERGHCVSSDIFLSDSLMFRETKMNSFIEIGLEAKVTNPQILIGRVEDTDSDGDEYDYDAPRRQSQEYFDVVLSHSKTEVEIPFMNNSDTLVELVFELVNKNAELFCGCFPSTCFLRPKSTMSVTFLFTLHQVHGKSGDKHCEFKDVVLVTKIKGTQLAFLSRFRLNARNLSSLAVPGS
jgi:hypothetical protein